MERCKSRTMIWIFKQASSNEGRLSFGAIIVGGDVLFLLFSCCTLQHDL
jgi:hypothetical protein